MIAQPKNSLEALGVVHPLFDKPEQKRSAEGLGPMKMSPSVRWMLLSLRAYLVLMFGLLAYHVLQLAGHLAHHAGR